MPGQCMWMLKPLGHPQAHRCPVPVVPGEVYCPLHLILTGRMKERAKKYRRLFRIPEELPL